MESKSTESGLEELRRLSKEITQVDLERTKAEQGHAEQRQKVRELQQGLIELKASVKLEKWVDNTSDSKQDMDSIKRSVKTLAILIELLFSIE